LRDLPWDEYRAFVLQLFQCREERNSIRGVRFDGFLGDDPVLVYDFRAHGGARIGDAFIADLSELCGSSLGPRCFIVAPALAVEPYEDYIEAGETRFFFLRIPYSIIAELHKRAFSELRQPDSAEAVNEFIESVGFDFIQPPRVECRYTRTGDAFVVKVEEFESEAYAATDSEENISDLAMVMVDADYDEEIFDLDAVFYAEGLQENDWSFELRASSAGEQLMLIYLDVYGNEHREVKKRADFTAP
jgi:site-specific DNA-methyltransferase (adenine-specific)/adenine-specific DNA-methyltransferase